MCSNGSPAPSERLTSPLHFPCSAARLPCGPAPASQSVHRTLRFATGPATMASREELEAEALKLFTGIGLVEKTAQ